MTDTPVERAKQNAGTVAAEQVRDGDVVGLGTGSTATYAIEVLGQRVSKGLSITGIPTSEQSRSLATEVGIPLTTLNDSTPTIAIDGADQVSPAALVKGGGGAHTHEKIVATAADRVLIVCDYTKEAEEITQSIPIEVLPRARPVVETAVQNVGGEPTLRSTPQGAIQTPEGNLILDCAFGTVHDPADHASMLSGIAGVVEHGLFVGVEDAVYWGTEDGDTRIEMR